VRQQRRDDPIDWMRATPLPRDLIARHAVVRGVEQSVRDAADQLAATVALTESDRHVQPR